MDAKWQRARRLRSTLTDAEQRLWQRVRGRQVDACKFRRQYPIDKFIVDFVCVERKVIIEVDGGQHAERCDADAARTAVLEDLGYGVL